jgi:UDP-glucose:(heptosyl)LPS alpha-1,3-glucosyltransferase
MRLAFAIITLFPWGGLQRDCLRMSQAAKEAGHDVTIFAARRYGEIPRHLDVKLLPVRSLTNHGRNRRFSEALRGAVAWCFDRVVGFDKIPGLDVLYCGDSCYAYAKRGLLRKLNPRVRGMHALEEACFGLNSRTHVLALAERQIAGYRRAWGTPPERITMLPPAIDSSRRHPEFRTDGTRERLRAELGLAADTLAFLSIGVWPSTKGFDRVVAALPEFKQAKLLVCGAAPQGREGLALVDQAHRLGIADRVSLLGPREDVPQLMAAADLLVHPARAEASGIVIIEAIINGLPVIATEICGFSPHIQEAEAGIVLPEPYTAQALIEALRRSAEPHLRAAWSAKGVSYGADSELYAGIDRAVQAIVKID